MKVSRLAEDLGKLEMAGRISALRRISPLLSLAERFDLLNELGIYHHPETISGAGSTLSETRELRLALPGLLREHSVHSILDIPCGDFNWLREVAIDDVEYLGADIVGSIVRRNRELYSSDKRRFEVLDATRDSLPRADLILCRDLLIHLSLADISRALWRFLESGASWLFATHYEKTERNTDILSGDCRPINLCAPPFNLPRPAFVLLENSRMANGLFADRAMALWPTSALGAGQEVRGAGWRG